MKKKQILALLTALVMVLGVCPGLAFAAETALTCTDSYISSTATTGIYTQDGFTTRPYALSWTGGEGNGYRMGVIAFDASSIGEDEVIVSATLEMTLYKTQNINQDGAKSTVTVYAFDPSLVDNTNASKPANGTKVGVITLTGAPTQQTDVNMTFSADLDLSGYLADYPGAEKIALYLTNRDDISECNSKGLAGFYGIDDGDKAPKLTVEAGNAASVKLSFKDENGNTIQNDTTLSGYVSGSTFSVNDKIAPPLLENNEGEYFTRDDFEPVTLKVGLNEVTVTYTRATVLGFESPVYIVGNEPNLPTQLNLLFEGGENVSIGVKSWTLKGDLPEDIEAAENVPYTIETEKKVEGKTEFDVNVIAYPCDNSVETFYSAGGSDSAHFSYYNSLGMDYCAGNAIFEAVFTINEGTNKLISYGNSSTGSFGGAAALLRFMNADVFEYYNGGWNSSSVKCETGKTYRLLTLADIDAKTYRMYITGEDKITYEVTDGPAKFRNEYISSIDRMFVHGCGDEGELNGVMTSQRSSWIDGFSVFTVKYEADDGTAIKDAFVTKYGTGKTYTASDAEKLVKIDGALYILNNVKTTPTHKVAEGKDEFVIGYTKVEVDKALPSEVSLVVGEASYNLPRQVRVQFTDGQYLMYDVEWNTGNVDLNIPGNYEISGIVTEYGIPAQCYVIVKEVQNLPKTSQNTVATNNGGWNWYVEPSGTHVQPGDGLASLFEGKAKDINGNTITYTSNGGYTFKEDKTYMGWVEDGGDIVVAELNHNTGEYKRVVIHEKLESDDHNNPAVVVLPDGRIMAVYSMHTNEAYMYFRVTKNPEDISEWMPEQYYHGTNANATYPSVFMVHDDEGIEGNDVIYIGWRGVHWKPTFAKFPIPTNGVFPTKADGSIQPIMEQTQFANTTYGYDTYNTGTSLPNAYEDGGVDDYGRRPYTKYDYDYQRNQIYITFTANHPDNDKRNHIFYLQLDIPGQNLCTAKGTVLQPLPKENASEYASQGANGTNGQWGVVTYKLYQAYPELVLFDATEGTGQDFNPLNGDVERRGWTWDISHNEKGEPCVVYADITATPPGEGGSLPTKYLAPDGDDGASRAHHYYWYARWDSDSQEWVNTFLCYGGKWWHQNYGQERCYSGGLTFDHNYPGNVIFLSIPVYGDYGNMHEIFRWESDDDGATWTKREPITENSKTPNCRPNIIYNYKMDENGDNQGPRLLWKTGEYRYWMNYEYKTGVMTDYADDGFVTQDDPEMFADAELYDNGNLVTEALTVGTTNLSAKFTVSNISIGDGEVKLALAHYGKDGALKNIITKDETIPARSVPQIGVIGAPKQTDDGSTSPWAKGSNLSKMGTPEIVVELPYDNAVIEEGDRISLFAWDNGIEKAMESVISVPFTATTDANEYLMRETFTYDGGEDGTKLVLDQNTDTFNGWVGKGYNSSGSVDFIDNEPNNASALGSSYAAITKAPFGNTGLHLFRTGGEGIMASHSLPDTNGQDYTIQFTVRYINEHSWNDTDNAGFTLSHGIPTKKGDSTNSSSAFQFRHGVAWRDENGRGTTGYSRNTTAFDGGSETQIFRAGLSRTIDTSDMIEGTYDKGVEYYDPKTETYIHDYDDSLMVGALYRFNVNVSPSNKQIIMTVNDGYRTATHVASFNDASSYDWDNNPIDTITFSIGSEKYGEMYIDDLSVKIGKGTINAKIVNISRADGGAFSLGSGSFIKVPISGGAYVFLDTADGKSIDVGNQYTDVGSSVGTYAYNGGDNQKFYVEEADGGYLIKGKQSGRYLGADENGNVTLQEKENATVFVFEEEGDSNLSEAELEAIVMIAEATEE